MSQGNPLNNLANAGYQQYTPSALLDPTDQNYINSNILNAAGKGITPTQAAAASSADADQTRAQEEGLVTQLQQGAAGQGPNAGQAQLAQATGQNIKNQAALAAAAGASGGGGAGAARYNAADQAGQLNQAAGNQAAQMGAQSQQQAIQGLAGVTGQIGGQDLSQQQMGNQVNQYNAEIANKAAQYNSDFAMQKAQLSNQQEQYDMGLQQQDLQAQNSAVAGLQGQQEQQQAAYTTAGISGATGGLSAIGSMFAKGGVIPGPRKIIAGEAGREAEVQVPRSFLPSSHLPDVSGVPMMAQGGVVGGPQDFSGRIAGLGNFVQNAIHGIRNRNSAPAAAGPQTSPANNWSSPVTDDTPTVGGGSELGDFNAPEAGGMAATGRVLTRPTMLTAGEAGPEAIIPIKKNGAADMKRAKDPGVRQLLSEHPEYKHPLTAADPHQETLEHLKMLKDEVAQLEKVLKSTKRKVA